MAQTQGSQLELLAAASNPVTFFTTLAKQAITGTFKDAERPDVRYLPFNLPPPTPPHPSAYGGGRPGRPGVRICGPMLPFRFEGIVVERPLDMWALQHGVLSVCSDREAGDDRAAQWFANQSLYFPVLRDIDLTTMAARPAVGGESLGRLDEAELLRELQLQQAALRAAPPTKFALINGVLELPGANDVQTYTYVGRDGVRKRITVGAFDSARELQALRACESQFGVGTADTVHCFQSLQRAAGMPVSLDEPIDFPNAPPPVSVGGTFGSGCSDGVCSLKAVEQTMPLNFGELLSDGGVFGAEPTFSPSGILDSIIGGAGKVLDNLPTVLQSLGGLVQSGAIRGDVGDFISRVTNAAPVATGGTGATPPTGPNLPQDQGLIAEFEAAVEALRQRLMSNLNPVGLTLNTLGLTGDGGGSTMLPSCPTLWKQSAARQYIPSRIQVQGPDGSVHVLLYAGKATRGSREKAVLKRLARDNGMRVCRRGGR